jgi:hypothetical protein
MLDRFADGPRWHKSTRSGETDCVEVAIDRAIVRVRDSQRPGPEVAFLPADWAAFLLLLKTDNL